MKKYYILVLLIIFFGCKSSNTFYSTIKGVTFINEIDLIRIHEGEVQKARYIDSVKYFKCGDISVIVVPSYSDSSRFKFSNEDSIFYRDSVWGAHVLNNYLLFEDKRSEGIFYNNKLSYIGTFNVDSLKRLKLVQGFPYFTSNDEFSRRFGLNDSLVEVYSQYVKKDESYADSAYFYFAGSLPDIDFHIAEPLEKLRGKRVVKVVYAYNPMNKDGYEIPRRELVFQLKKTNISDQKDLTFLIQQFEKDKIKLTKSVGSK